MLQSLDSIYVKDFHLERFILIRLGNTQCAHKLGTHFYARSTLPISILLAASVRRNEIITAYTDTIISFIKIRLDNRKIAGV